MPNPEASQEQSYDHLDDTSIFDAATIRKMTGYESDGGNEDFTADAIAARTGSVAMSGFNTAEPKTGRDQWVESFNLTHPSNVHPSITYRTPGERAALSAHVSNARQQLTARPKGY